MPPNDPLYPEQWALDPMNAQAGWACMPPGAPAIVVAVIDSGVAANHEDLPQPPQLLPPRTVIPGQTRDDEDHGTLVAGTIAAIRNNGMGIAGAASVQILPVKFCSPQFLPNADFGAQAIDLALSGPPDTMPGVIVLAWDCGFDTPQLHAAMVNAGDKDVVVVVAAGNHSLNNDIYPNWPANYGNMDHVITVMATDVTRVLTTDTQGAPVLAVTDERASFSNWGQQSVLVAAPVTTGRATIASVRTDNVSTVPYYGPRTSGAMSSVLATSPASYLSGYRGYGGTSAAAAYVAGLAALVRAKNPGWPAPQVKAHIRATARPVLALATFCASGGVADYEAALCP